MYIKKKFKSNSNSRTYQNNYENFTGGGFAEWMEAFKREQKRQEQEAKQREEEAREMQRKEEEERKKREQEAQKRRDDDLKRQAKNAQKEKEEGVTLEDLFRVRKNSLGKKPKENPKQMGLF